MFTHCRVNHNLLLCMTLCPPKFFRRTLFSQAVLLSSSAWLLSVLVPLTVFHAKQSASVNAYLDWIQLLSFSVNTIENALDITSRFSIWELRSPPPGLRSISLCSRHTVRHFFSCGLSWAGTWEESCSNWSPNKQDILSPVIPGKEWDYSDRLCWC